MVLLLLLWLFFIILLIYQSQHDMSELTQDQRYDMILRVADSLAGQPERQHESLGDIDRFQRGTEGLEDEPLMRMSMLVRRGETLLFVSPGLPAGIRNSRLNEIEKLGAGSRMWRVRSRASPRSAIVVTLVKPADAVNVLLTFTSRGFLLLPLLISLPFLAIPAWLSLRLALRPLSRVTQEIAARGPRDLSALGFRPRHRELQPLVANLNALLERVCDSARRENEFIADAAHELRTPLTAMRINVEALKTAAGEGTRQELLDGMVRSGDRASRVVGQLLSLMRADQAPMPATRRVALMPLLQDRLALLSGLAAVRGIELDLEMQADWEAVGEYEALAAMLDNLIENAIKYSPDAGTVSIRVTRQADRTVLSVSDQGPGIPPELRKRVFGRFFRAPGQSQTGSGLGLAIVKSAVERHGGEIELASAQDGRGLRVTVTLPSPKAWPTAAQG